MAHILLYGGTFDPIHNGHLVPCRRARELLHADTVLFIPAGLSPHKTAASPVASVEDRLAMIRLAIQDDPHSAVDARELSRPGPSFTYDTVMALRSERPSDTFTLLLGADQLPKLGTWHRVAELLQSVPLAILPRPGASNGAGHMVLDTPRIDISATDIRRRVRAGQPIDTLVPGAVADYIRLHHLYCR